MIEALKGPAKKTMATGLILTSLLSGCNSTQEHLGENEFIIEPNVVVDLTEENSTVFLDTTIPEIPTFTDTTHQDIDQESGTTQLMQAFPSVSSHIVRVVIESQNPEIGTIQDNSDIVYDDTVANPTPYQLGVLHPDDNRTITTVSQESSLIIIGGHSNADKIYGDKAATYGVIDAERYPYGNMPDDPGVSPGDSIKLETSDGYSCNYSIVDLRNILLLPEFAEFAGDLDVYKPYLDEGVYPLVNSPGAYGGKTYVGEIGPDYGKRSLEAFLIKASEVLNQPMVAIMGSYAGTSGEDFVWSKELEQWQSAWLFGVGAVLDECVRIEEIFDK